MPRWRRRRFQRLRKCLRDRPDDHTWVLHKTETRHNNKFDLPSMNGNPALTINLKMNFILCESWETTPEGQPAGFAKAKLFRRCSVCGMELIGKAKPQISCRENLVKKVMEA